MTEQVDVNVVEQEARQSGWVPKEEFRGSEAEWVDAETFVKRGKEINQILRANNERLKKDLLADRDKHEKELLELRQGVEEFKQFQKEAYERKQQLLQSELDALKKERRAAMKDGDTERALEIEDQIDEVKEEQAKAKEAKPVEQTKQSEAQVQDPVVTEWIGKNDWYGVDIEATEITNAIGATINKQFPNLKGKAFLDKVDERLKQRLPELFENPNQARAAVEGASTRGTTTSGKKSYDNLPAEAKSACDRFVKQGLFKSREEYVALYDWEQ